MISLFNEEKKLLMSFKRENNSLRKKRNTVEFIALNDWHCVYN